MQPEGVRLPESLKNLGVIDSFRTAGRQSDMPECMASRTAATTREPVGRLGQRGQVVIPRSAVDPDDVLSPEQSALVKKAEQEMSQGKYVTLAELKHELAHHRSPRSRKTA
jgi:hypothetical protein